MKNEITKNQQCEAPCALAHREVEQGKLAQHNFVDKKLGILNTWWEN